MTSSSAVIVGLGNLGSPLASRLLEVGWDVAVLDTAEERVAELRGEGAREIDVADLGREPLVCFVVPGEQAIRSVLERVEGPLEGLVVVISTLAPQTAIDVAATLAERGARMIDAPVSGGADRARAGELTVLVGGADEHVADARPLLDAIGDTVLHVGPVGAGSAAKLANQLVTFASLGAVLEAARLADAYGVAESTVIEALGTATGDTWVGRTWGFYDDLAADYDRRDVPDDDRPWVKDLAAVRAAASGAGLEVPVADVLSRTLADDIRTHAQRSRQTDSEGAQEGADA
ncbi:3-hydroxyisobutyrate dehydrogenase/2-hydroxy-3-oxopropionate reductase [Diaminobutyricimonas aerilata]|uniref:3-hydroxyisobutyrate dehydrogenase/2-hydroxy-3-oxopropionate reductase n=1 Tax=Diaminobutyricimonas aerilata TaxID=1162967 RepID=A0A2M9CMA8_9MICO|nr:NAD(P)-dependent oxidoreductase [Diaminobutyricimonas aerilata]PJJ73025.1 3-hydroxyisobutyrate dehydrogenase/2-hydroxy-3-oxopropionate reductase [Diaminobutyricimonas aerilata]